MHTRNVTTGAAALMLMATAIAFHNSFSGAFVLDDIQGIVENPTLRDLWPLTGPLTVIPGGLTVSGRPLLNLSFAINYAISGTDLWSYHALNLLIHMLAGLALFGVVRRSLEKIRHPSALPLAALVSALWMVHPLQTESVTYVIQRAESLMGLFYLVSLYATIRGADSHRPWIWYVAATLSCALGMVTKEMTITAPILILLYDRAFLSGSFAEAWRRRKGLHIALFLTSLPLLWIVAMLGNREGSAGFGVAVPWWSHAAMQFGAITHYLWLSLWPNPLIFDYGVLEPHSLLDVIPHAIVVVALLAVTVLGLVRNRTWAILGVWFFLILAPTTSIMPSNRQTLSEHRMYLPLAALSVVAVLALFVLARRQTRLTVLIGALWVAILVMVTIDRNRDYRSDLALYANVVTNYPNNSFGQFVYGTALLTRGADAQALEHLDIAVANNKTDRPMRINRAYALLRLKRPAEAVAEYEAGFRLGPVGPEAYLGYAAALVEVGRQEEGMQYFREYTQRRPNDASAHFVVGQLLLAAGKTGEAIVFLERAHGIAPENEEIAAALQQARASRSEQ